MADLELLFVTVRRLMISMDFVTPWQHPGLMCQRVVPIEPGFLAIRYITIDYVSALSASSIRAHFASSTTAVSRSDQGDGDHGGTVYVTRNKCRNSSNRPNAKRET